MLLNRVLIVEDDLELARVLRRYLEAQGYEILLAHKGYDALQICQTEPLAALLLDIKLPDVDGYHVLTTLRGNASTQHLPVIILTQKDERLPSGVELQPWDGYLTKPFEFAELNHCLRQAIDEFRGQRSASPSATTPEIQGRTGDETNLCSTPSQPPPARRRSQNRSSNGTDKEQSYPQTSLAPQKGGEKAKIPPSGGLGGPKPAAENLDHSRQLAEQIFLWETAPALARALIEVDRLIANRVHDMSKIGALLSLVKAPDTSDETFQQLQQRLYHCRLAYENLNTIRYKLRGYRSFPPASLADVLADVSAWFDRPELIDLPSAEAAQVTVALPQLRLQQLLYNSCQWLLEGGATRLRLDLETDGEAIRLHLSPENDHPPTRGWLEAIHEASDEAVYAYLTHKIVTRYGGTCEVGQAGVRLNLPGIAPVDLDEQSLAQNVETRAAHLATLEDLMEADDATYQTARWLIDPLAADLLVKLRATSNLLETTLDIETSPWLAIYHNVSFFELLTFDLCRHQPMNLEPVDLPALLRQIQSLLAHRLIDHQIVVEIDEQPADLVTDKTRLLLSLIHLAMNALESMPEGGIVCCRVWHCSENIIRIEVADSGVGIAAEFLPDQLFERRATTKGLGRGLGLYHVRRYIEELGGQIKIESTVGQGTKVLVELPTALLP